MVAMFTDLRESPGTQRYPGNGMDDVSDMAQVAVVGDYILVGARSVSINLYS